MSLNSENARDSRIDDGGREKNEAMKIDSVTMSISATADCCHNMRHSVVLLKSNHV
jgi:hypothetical protein